MQIVDLSQDIYEGMKVYPGHLKTDPCGLVLPP